MRRRQPLQVPWSSPPMDLRREPAPNNRASVSLARPIPLAAVALLVLNDHLFKGSRVLPGWLTGKLSDIAGLFFFPLLLIAVVRPPCSRRVAATFATLATATGFAGVKLVPAVNAVVTSAWGMMVMDRTDLLTLPILAASWMWIVRAGPSGRRWSDHLGVVAAALASLATSPHARPLAPEPPEVGHPCARLEPMSCEVIADFDVRLWVRATNASPAECEVTVSSVRERHEGVEVETRLDPPPHVALAAGSVAALDLPVGRAFPIASTPNLLLRLLLHEHGAIESYEGTSELWFACRPQERPR